MPAGTFAGGEDHVAATSTTNWRNESVPNDHVRDKDALDILRLLQAIETQAFSDGFAASTGRGGVSRRHR